MSMYPVKKYYSYRSSDKAVLAELCLRYRLYSPGGYMHSFYKRIVNGDSEANLVVSFVTTKPKSPNIKVRRKNQYPMGAIAGFNNNIMVFVSPDFRGSGVGSRLIEAYCKKYNMKREDLRATYGTKASGGFFFANRIQRVSSHMSFLTQMGYVTLNHGRKIRIPPWKRAQL